jgi:hypothetical protein
MRLPTGLVNGWAAGSGKAVKSPDFSAPRKFFSAFQHFLRDLQRK